MNSSNSLPGVYGTLGTPATGNIPGGRDGAATWTDLNGNFWLFGGEAFDANGNFGPLNDLWEFQPSTQEWTWIGGSSTVPAGCAGSTTVVCGQPGVYGTLGSAAVSNIPGGRSQASFWTDPNGNFWLFAGYGFDGGQNLGELNDLWEFDPSTKQWTWMGGSSVVGSAGGQTGVYGTFGLADSANTPGGRDSTVNWTDKSGRFWIYGGQGFDGQGNYGQLNDLWSLDLTTKQWTWRGGGSTLPAACATNATIGLPCGWPATYGTLGVSAPGIGPGSRVGAAGWTDGNGNLWLFGGLGSVFWEQSDFSEIDQYDLWEFNPATNQWAWMSGNTTALCSEGGSGPICAQTGNFGTQGIPSVANIPPSRNNANTWTDSNDNLWLFGGAEPETTNVLGAYLCDDVWVFEPAANEWAWMGLDAQVTKDTCGAGIYGTYGVLGTPAPANAPSGRSGAASWTDSSGNLWIFGGYGWTPSTPELADINDLWVYKPVAPVPTPSFALNASPNPINIPAIGTGTSAITTAITTINIIAGDGFDSPVSLSATSSTCNGVPCITGSFSPAIITGGGSSTLTLSVTGSDFPGPISSVPFTITGTSGGVSQSIQVVVDVTQIGQIAAPTFSPPAGTYSTPQTVSILVSNFNGYATPGIYYTMDGSTPNASSAVYVNPITVSSTTTLKAVVIELSQQSAASSATFTIVPAAAAPVFAPGGGTYSSAQSVTLTDSTPGATIYYTTDGSTPTSGSSTYSAPITVSSSETLQAIATANGYSTSAVASAAYTIDLPGFSITGTPVSVTPGSTTGNTSTITLTPSGGFTGSISLSCAITPVAASDPATCSLQQSVTISGASAQTTTLTVNTTAATSALNKARWFFWPSAGGVALACMLFVWTPSSRKRWQAMLGMFVLLSSITCNIVACGGGGNGSGGGGTGGGGGNMGTTPGAYTITVTGTSGSATQKATISLVVQ